MAITAGYDQVRMIDPLAGSQMPLVLLPGMDGTGVLFAPFIAALGPGYRVIVVTYPTHEPLGYEALLPIARAVLPEDGPFGGLPGDVRFRWRGTHRVGRGSKEAR
jgi:hypothetical protein